MAKSRMFAGVLRLGDVRVLRAELEAALDVELDRYELSQTGSAHYGQIDLPVEKGMAEDEVWRDVVGCIQAIGPKISALKSGGAIGSATVDLAVAFTEDRVTLFVEVPSYAAEAIGRHGIDIDLSVYLTAKSATA